MVFQKRTAVLRHGGGQPGILRGHALLDHRGEQRAGRVDDRLPGLTGDGPGKAAAADGGFGSGQPDAATDAAAGGCFGCGGNNVKAGDGQPLQRGGVAADGAAGGDQRFDAPAQQPGGDLPGKGVNLAGGAAAVGHPGGITEV